LNYFPGIKSCKAFGNPEINRANWKILLQSTSVILHPDKVQILFCN
jgi:hypothetical protein